MHEACKKQAGSLIALRDLAVDIRDRLARLDLPENYPAMFREQLGHAQKAGYISDSEYNDLANLVVDVENHLPLDPLPEMKPPLVEVMQERMEKLQQPLQDAIKLKDKTEDTMFQKVAACECLGKLEF